MNSIPLSVPSIQGNEWQYIKECLDSEWVSSAGQFVERFEADICKFTSASYAVACVNGTAALQVALQLVGVEPGDEVIVPTVTFIAPINAVRYRNAEPIFMDCDEFYNIDVEKTVQFLNEETDFRNGFTWNRRTGKRISAIIPVHVFGNAADLASLLAVCKERNIKIVEDATESLGTFYKQGELQGRYTGTIGEVGCYSFNGNKIITTGGGGMIVTKNKQLAEKAKYLTTQAKDDSIRYVHNEIGYNFRLTNIQAAMGVAQLEKLPEFIAIKKKNYRAYKSALADIPGLHLAETPVYADNNCWMYALQVDKEIYGKNGNEVMSKLALNHIQSRPLWYLNHLQKPYEKFNFYLIENAFKMLKRTINLPCSINLSLEDICRIVKVIKDE